MTAAAARQRPQRSTVMRSAPSNQRGVSLIVSLVLLVIVTMLAVGSLRGVLMQSRMSGTTTDRSMAFEAAEAALRDAERRAALVDTSIFPAAGCTGGYCKTPAAADTPRWMNEAFTDWRTSTAAAPANAPPQQAIVEDMGDAPNWAGCENEIPRQPNCSTRRYRITSRSTADGRATVLVQSQFAAP
jgi:type IV pilus assembly protein PilX